MARSISFMKDTFLNEQFSYSSFPDKFWGLGKNTSDTAEEAYKFRQYYVYVHLLRRIADHFFIGVLYEKQKVWDVDYLAGGAFDKQNVAGRKGYSISGVGSSLTYDSRNNAFEPEKGFFGQLYFNHFDRFWGSDYNYNNVVIDLRTYIPFAHTQVLAMPALQFQQYRQRDPYPQPCIFRWRFANEGIL